MLNSLWKLLTTLPPNRQPCWNCSLDWEESLNLNNSITLISLIEFFESFGRSLNCFLPSLGWHISSSHYILVNSLWQNILYIYRKRIRPTLALNPTSDAIGPTSNTGRETTAFVRLCRDFGRRELMGQFISQLSG